MNDINLYWMKHSINIAERAFPTHLRVGVVLVSYKNECIASAHTGDAGGTSWCASLIHKIKAHRIKQAKSLYVTINTLSGPTSFDINDVLNEIAIEEIYVGIPDPALTSYLNNDPVITHPQVHRYPEELQREILAQNKRQFSSSSQSITHSPYYSENRISRLVINNLKSKGFDITKKELNSNKHQTELALLLCQKYGTDYSSAIRIVHSAISEAFNIKYSTYSYTDDTRSLDPNWKDRFLSIYKTVVCIPMPELDIINVGVGGGHEAIALFSNCPSITFVDIAHGGLKNIKKNLPCSNTTIASADNLSTVPNCSYDLYISLRTFNSSFFDIEQAIKEAKRILKPNATIIISVANGFLCPERNCIIPGLIVPGTEFVDVYRGMDTAKQVHTAFIQAEFQEIQLYPTNTEIFLTARCK